MSRENAEQYPFRRHVDQIALYATKLARARSKRSRDDACVAIAAHLGVLRRLAAELEGVPAPIRGAP